MSKSAKAKPAKSGPKRSSPRKLAWVEKTPNGGMTLHLALVEPETAAEKRQVARAQKKWWDWRRSVDPEGYEKAMSGLVEILARTVARDILREQYPSMSESVIDQWINQSPA